MKNSATQSNPTQAIRRPRYAVTVLLLIAIIGAIAAFSYAFNLRAMGWDGGRSSGLSIPVGQFIKSDRAPVLLYASPDTTQYLASVGGNYEVILKPWRNFFVQQKIAFEEITKVEALPPDRAGVLILPSVVSISESEQQAILQFRNRGGSILATSTLGARDGKGEWAGYAFAKELLGVTVTGEIPPDKEERHLNLFGDLPFSQSYKVAERIWLGKIGANPLRLTGGQPAGLITDWARTSVSGEGAENAAVLYDEFGSDKQYARWVMLSFSEVNWEVQRNDVHNLISNAITWLEHRPVLYKANWPFPYRAAQIIEMDTEEGFPNAERFAAMMEKIDATATFYMLTSEAIRYPDVVKKLARRHEIGYHGDVHDGFKGQPEAVQAKRIDNMQAHMKSILGNIDSVTGFRAPTESYDKVTEDLLRQKGIRHHAADPNRSDARLPLFYPDTKGESQQALVVLPRTQLDDINLIQAGKNDPALIKAALINDFDQALQVGALGFLSIHTQYFAEDNPLALAMPDFLSHLNKHREQLWLAPAGEIAHWWRERERLTYRVSDAQARLDLDVSITGNGPMPAGSLIVSNPFAKAIANVRPLRSNTPLPEVRALDDFRTALVFSNVPPGSYAYAITFTND